VPLIMLDAGLSVSRHALAVAERPLRRKYATPFLQLLRTFDPDAPADQPAVARVADTFATPEAAADLDAAAKAVAPSRE